MGLLKCRECGKQIAESATACPGCGAPSKAIIDREELEASRKPYHIVLSLILLAVLAWFVVVKLLPYGDIVVYK
jgi:uncharacterized membrane protein YvbJ